MAGQNDNSARMQLKKWAKICTRWALRFFPAILLAAIFLHKEIPGSIDAVAAFIRISPDHAIGLLILLCVSQILEGYFSLEEKISDPPITSHLSEALAYEHLCHIIRGRHVQRVDLVQVSGQTAVHFLSSLSQIHKDCQVRLLLLHSDVATRLDDDNHPDEGFDHTQRAYATKSSIQTMKSRGSRFNVVIKYYRSYPGVCSVQVDDASVCVGWYRTFFDGPDVMRVRSHNVPAIVADGDHAEPLLSFAKSHFEKLWEFAETDPAARVITHKQV